MAACRLWKSLRDSHIPAAATNAGKVESQTQPSHFPSATAIPLYEFKPKTRSPEARSYAPPFRLILQLENADNCEG